MRSDVLTPPTPSTRHPHRSIPILIGGVALLVLGCRTDRAALVRPVVRLSVPGGGGTGTIIARRGHTYLVLTAGHVVIPHRRGVVPGPETNPSPTSRRWAVKVDAFGPDELGRPGHVLRASLEPDLALVRVEFDVARDPIRICTSGPYAGQPVLAAGCPGGIRPWWCAGFVVGPTHELFPPGTWCINASVAGGCSGGPVIDTDTGHLVGVVSGGLLVRSGPFSAAPVPGVGAMVPSTTVRRWLGR